jgi:hypothetical protein
MELSQCNFGMFVLLLPEDYEQTMYLAPHLDFWQEIITKVRKCITY